MWKESLMMSFLNQILLKVWQMTNFSKIELKFAIKHFISCFSYCNSDEDLLTSFCICAERILYDSFIACLREECWAQISVSRMFIQFCRSIKLLSNMISNSNHINSRDLSYHQVSFWNILIVVLKTFFSKWNSFQIIKSHFIHVRIFQSL